MARKHSAREMIGTGFRWRLPWLVAALVVFPLGHWIAGRVLPRDPSTGQLIAVCALAAVLVAWASVEANRRR